MNGKAEAASGAPTCEKRVNTFSFCGTGGSPGKNAANLVCGALYLRKIPILNGGSFVNKDFEWAIP